MEHSKLALVLVDIQNDYFPGGRNELEGSPEAGQQAARVLANFRLNKIPLIHIQHIFNRPGATFFLPDTAGAEIHAVVKPLAGETIIQKHYPNSFRETTLLETLRGWGITRLVIAGSMTHMCIDTTTRAAYDLGFECMLVHNACATKSLKFADHIIPAAQVHGAFMAALATFAKILSVDELFAL